MKTREHTSLDGIESSATFSDDEVFRYRLIRRWDRGAVPLIFIMLNPSTATEEVNDPTIERCQRRARAGRFGGIVILNLFAFRATDPRDMKKALDPIGRDNDAFIREAIEHANHDGDIICGWGTHGSFMQRDKQVLNMFRDGGINPMALKVTKDGHPSHPLYIPYTATPVPLRRAA